ncbi:DAR GTPase 2, mitochondrial isoform X3 [Miscanthus floridulus]|uniref:DAR GTPase 2, mitochondrial isoform X3 n=1 Tax=Miscanthus floridulus TaxID=154761 RepID=UPI00345A2D94
MTAAAAEAVSRRLGAAVRDLSGSWYGRHMAAAERAIRARLPLVDLVLEVRDARVPDSSSFEPLRRRRGPLDPDRRRVVLLNKADLADPSETELLNVVQTRIREIKHGENNCTGTALLVGIPNVGKSAIVNAMHQIGRIAAAEKGKLKHAIVSSHPGETRDISGYKVASHPNIYVLDTPGVLSPRFKDDGSGPRLALTGAIKDSLLEDYDIVQFLLAIVNSGKEYRKWDKLNKAGDTFSCGNTITSRGHNNKGQHASDHTQDFFVKAVRQVLFETVSRFNGDLGHVDELRRLIGHQLVNLQEVFKVSTESSKDMCKPIALKLLNLYRTGRLGHYTLENVPDVRQEVVA